MRFGSKVPGTAMEIRDVNMDFAYGGSFTEASPEAYERLILDVLLGDPPLFPRHEEVELSWKILDPILELLGRRAAAEAGAVRRPAPGDRSPPTQMLARDGRTLEASAPDHDRGPTIELPTPTPSEIAAEFVRARTRAGSPAHGHGDDPGHRRREEDAADGA